MKTEEILRREAEYRAMREALGTALLVWEHLRSSASDRLGWHPEEQPAAAPLRPSDRTSPDGSLRQDG